MNRFTDEEATYLREQPIGRLATVGPDGQPHAVPVSFRLNAELGTIDIGGHDFTNRKKFRDVQHNSLVAFVVDDLVSVSPWRVRGIEVRGEATILSTGGTDIGPGFDPVMFRIRPHRIAQWGLDDAQPFGSSTRSVDR